MLGYLMSPPPVVLSVQRKSLKLCTTGVDVVCSGSFAGLGPLVAVVVIALRLSCMWFVTRVEPGPISVKLDVNQVWIVELKLNVV